MLLINGELEFNKSCVLILPNKMYNIASFSISEKHINRNIAMTDTINLIICGKLSLYVIKNRRIKTRRDNMEFIPMEIGKNLIR